MTYYDTYGQNKSYSSYWMDFDDDEDDIFKSNQPGSPDADQPVENIYSTERVVKLASVRRAIANFVRILTNNEKIKVVFSSGKESYTDGKEVVIAAEEDSAHFDSMVGLALHEGAHCLLSDFNLIKNVLSVKNGLQFLMCLKPELRDSIMTDAKTGKTNIHTAEFTIKIKEMQKTIGFIMNVIEDRRIDSFIYKNAVGYRPYYDAMYKKYFFNSEVTKHIKYNPEWRVPTVENYINWLINIFHPNFDRNALPGLSQMVDMVDLDNIRKYDAANKMPEHFTAWKVSNLTPLDFTKYYGEFYLPNGTIELRPIKYNSLPLLWRTANDIMHLMMQYVVNHNNSQTGDKKPEDNTMQMGPNGASFSVDPNGLENLDLNQNAPMPIPSRVKLNEKKAKSGMDSIKKVMSGEHRRKKLKAKEKADIQHLESADAKIVEAGDKIIGKFPCLVLNNITRQIMESSVFPFKMTNYIDYPKGTLSMYKSPQYENAVVKGVQMGQILVHRLQVRNDPQITHFTRQPHGKIDRRILAQLGMDIEQVFKRTTIENYRPAMLHLSLDASGSMQGRKWEKVLSVATALAYVASKIDNIEVVITIRGEVELPIVAVMYDSRKDTFKKARLLFPYMSPAGSTPEGLCFKATLDMITSCAIDHDTYFINFSDGEPGCGVRRNGTYLSYSGVAAHDHTRRQVQVMRDANVKVLSYFITEANALFAFSVLTSLTGNSSWVAFKRMYGEDAVNVNVENATEVTRTLNRLLLKKG